MEATVAFVTLFLGLVSGPQRVEVAVTGPVAVVELAVDDQVVARLEEPPWQVGLDFGPRIEPHRLVAVARDRSGREIGRAVQWLNLPRASAEAEFLLERFDDGTLVASLTWSSLTAEQPDRLAVFFDGAPLPVDDPTRIVLPPHDPQALHLLRAELDFPDNVSAVAETTFGGFYADRASSELTAVPLTSERPLTMDRLAGALRIGDRPARLVAIEEGTAEIMVVRDRSAVRPLQLVLERALRLRPFGAGTLDDVRGAVPLPADATLQFLWPHPESRAQGERAIDLFPGSPRLTGEVGGWLWLLGEALQPAYPPASQRLADATAVAGLNVMRRNRRRAVVLVVGPQPRDVSQLDPAAVRHYLTTIGVPLSVWQVGRQPRGGAAEDLEGWGPMTRIEDWQDLERAVAELHEGLARQRVVWVDGRHLPQELHLVEGIEGVERVR